MVHISVATCNLAGLDGFSWTRSNGQLEILWELDEYKAKVKERLDYILNGCECKTGCHTKRCKCKKAGRVMWAGMPVYELCKHSPWVGGME